MNEVLIRLEKVSKVYPPPIGGAGGLRTLWALLRGRGSRSGFHALQGIDLEVRRGQSLGLIGANGAGKSTLMKIVAGVVAPSTGTVSVDARVSALLELGAGFHPEYTGRENVFLASALMGVPERETRRRLDDILAFADIGGHIDEPVKHYSSGMVVRLGFAVATAVKPDVLVTDEVLAVGDESFQRKCVAWMEAYLCGGGTMLLCSHSMYHIEKLCLNAAWIEDGRIRQYGPSNTVVRDYLAWHDARTAPAPTQTHRHEDAVASGLYALESFEANGRTDTLDLPMGSDLSLAGVVFSPDGRPPGVAVGLVRMDGSALFGLSSEMCGVTLRPLGDRRFGFRLRLPRLPLLPGRYEVRAHAMDPEGFRLFDQSSVSLVVSGETRELGAVRLQYEWELE
ncbi:MAG TPA: ABC transporter ATP-binding protein [Azoarcus taiwanensis]|nr:ABC transporter ATP-binding protein [Azoarcus taiwanensis]